MNSRQLYRYVFGQWNDLSTDEVANVKTFFANISRIDILRSQLRDVNNAQLYAALYDGEKLGVSHPFSPAKDTLKRYMMSYDKENHYFEKQPVKDTFAIFKSLATFFYFIEKLRNPFGHPHNLSCYDLAYKVMVIFGGENTIDEILDRFDEYCYANQLFITKVEVYKLLPLELPCDPLQANINLARWREIIKTNGLKLSWPLFYIAAAIEAKLGHAPTDFAEAMSGAKAITYTTAARCPQHAQLCSTHCIPEKTFNRSICANKEARIDARQWILKHLPTERHSEYVRTLPDLVTDFEEFIAIATSLAKYAKHTLIEMFQPEKLVKMVCANNNYYTSFLKELLPDTHQVDFVMSIFDIKQIRELIFSHQHIIAHLKFISSNERLNYIIQIVGAEKLIPSLYQAWHYLDAILKSLPDQSDRYKLMFDVIGVGHLRLIVGLNRAEIASNLSSHQRVEFYNRLLTPEEKRAEAEMLKLKQQIINTDFPIGIFSTGYGGCEITLDDETKKIVPTVVALHWNEINRAERQLVSYTEAWKKIQDSGNEAANDQPSILAPSTYITYFSRQHPTVTYYQQFKRAEQKQHVPGMTS